MADYFKQHLVPVEIVREIIGHDRSDDVTFGRYGKAYKSHVLKEFIDQLDFGVDLGHLKGKWRELASMRQRTR